MSNSGLSMAVDDDDDDDDETFLSSGTRGPYELELLDNNVWLRGQSAAHVTYHSFCATMTYLHFF